MDALFLRVPKTASTSIVNTIRSGDKNITYIRTGKRLNAIERHNEWFDLEKVFTFGFVRNPWDRAVSSWKFGGNGSEWKMSFIDFCKNLKTLDLFPPDKIAKSSLLLHACEQHPFLICEEKGLKASFIGKFENLQNDFDAICEKIGIPSKTLPHCKKTKHKHYAEYYDDESRELVAKKYAKDIKYFGYEF